MMKNKIWIVPSLLVVLVMGYTMQGCEQMHISSQEQKEFQDRFEMMRQLAKESNPLFTEQFESFLSKSLQVPDSLEYVRALSLGSAYYLNVGRGQNSIDLLNKAYPIAYRQNYSKHLRFITMQFGMTYLLMGSYDLALEYMLESMQLREAEGDLDELAVACNNIGLAYYKLLDNELALEYFRRTAAIMNELDKPEVVFSYVNIGLAYSEMALYDSATSYYSKARLEAEQSNLSTPHVLEMSLSFAEGKTLLDLQKFEAARERFLASYRLSSTWSDLRYQAESQLHLARVFIAQKKFVEANRALEEAMVICHEVGLREILLNVYREKTVVAERLGDLDNEVFFQERYIELAQNLYHDRVFNKISALKIAFAKRENLNLIAEQKSTLEVYDEMIDKRSRLILLVIGAIALAVSTTIYFVKSRKRRDLWNKELDQLIYEKTRKLEENSISKTKAEAELTASREDFRRSIKDRLATLEGLCNLQLMQSGHESGKLKSMISEIRRLRELSEEYDYCK